MEEEEEGVEEEEEGPEVADAIEALLTEIPLTSWISPSNHAPVVESRTSTNSPTLTNWTGINNST